MGLRFTLLAVLAVVAGCSHHGAPPPVAERPPPPPPPPAASLDATAPLDAALAVDALPADAAPPLDAALPIDAASPTGLRSCPKTYGEAASATCDLAQADKLACKYRAGHCECHTFSPCAGWAGAYEEARQHPRAVWSCTPAVRPDGCPGDAPAQGSRCAKPGQECAYVPCGGTVLACRAGTWKVVRQIGGPP